MSKQESEIVLPYDFEPDFETAVKNGKLSSIKYMDEKHISYDKKKDSVYLAVKYNQIEILIYLISKGQDVHQRDEYCRTIPLNIAVQNGYTDMAKFLLDQKVYVDSRDGLTGMTPLHVAAQKGYIEIAEKLLEKGAYIEARGSDDCTPLLYAAKSGNKEMIKFLIEKNDADTTAVDIYDRSLLSLALIGGNPDAVKYIIQKVKPKDINAEMRFATTKELKDALMAHHSE